MENLTKEAGDAAPEWPLNTLIPDIPFDTYCKIDAANSHGLMDLLRSPAYYQSRKAGNDHETKALLFGRLVHAAMLEPARFRKHHIVPPKFNRATTVGKLAHKEFYGALSPDAIVIPEDEVEPLIAIAERAQSHPVLRGLFENGVRETTMLWRDQETGELCKMRPDFVTTDGIIVDLKTTMDARPEPFADAVRKYGYGVQAAHYCSGAITAGIQKHPQFMWIAIEKEPPYDLRNYEAYGTALTLGERRRATAMKIYSRCKATGEWPGYPPEIEPLELPAWAEEKSGREMDILSARWGLQ